ncbi:hypothetical protein ACQ5SI_26285 [Peribacillus frigoritolerans]|uniref:hypothetical protein n=1 Tax=Peribacillus frigoritolerans TaxID=450367 RepID=UPI003D33C932
MEFKDIPKINLKGITPVNMMPTINTSGSNKVMEAIANSNRLKDIEKHEQQLKEQEKEMRDQQLLKLVEQIMKNTAYLPEMVGLVRKNNEINEGMLELFKEMTNVLRAQSQEEAQNIVLDVVEKAKNTNDALEAMSGLLNYGKLLINLVFPDSDLGI